MKKAFLLLSILFFCSCGSQEPVVVRRVQENNASKKPFLSPVGMVNDFAKVFTQTESEELEQKLNAYRNETGHEIVVVSIDVDTLQEANFFMYSIQLANYWGLGRKEENDGLMVAFSPKLRKLRINTGKGIEHILTDEICKKILTQTILPSFKNGSYFDGVNAGIDSLIIAWID